MRNIKPKKIKKVNQRSIKELKTEIDKLESKGDNSLHLNNIKKRLQVIKDTIY